MEQYLSITEAYLAMIQTTLSDSEMKASTKAAEEMYEAITLVTEKHELSIKEMLNATVGIHLSIINSINDDLNKEREHQAREYE